MKNKKLFLFSIFFIFIISLGAASASEDMASENMLNDDLSMNPIDQSIDESIDLNINTDFQSGNNELIGSDSDSQSNADTEPASDGNEGETANTGGNASTNTIQTNKKSFEYIQELIDNAAPGSTIKLSGSYAGTGKQIVINKAITIKGIGGKATLNAKGLSRIFYIKSKGVLLEDLNLINGKANKGGAIYVESNNAKVYSTKIHKCIFRNNTGKSGGAIYSGANIKITRTRFNLNTAKSGGAICCEDDDDINKDIMYINNSVFYKNKIYKENRANGREVTYNSGGAVLTDFKKSYIFNCKFSQNRATTKGGAIGLTRNLNCINCKFYKNYASTGSVIDVTPNIIDFEEYSFDGIINVKNCVLSKNSAKNKILLRCDYLTAKMNIVNLVIGNYKYTITNKKNHYFYVKIINKKTKKAVRGAKIRFKIKPYSESSKTTIKTLKKTNKKGKITFNARSLIRNKYLYDSCYFYLSFVNSKNYFYMNSGIIDRV